MALNCMWFGLFEEHGVPERLLVRYFEVQLQQLDAYDEEWLRHLSVQNKKDAQFLSFSARTEERPWVSVSRIKHGYYLPMMKDLGFDIAQHVLEGWGQPYVLDIRYQSRKHWWSHVCAIPNLSDQLNMSIITYSSHTMQVDEEVDPISLGFHFVHLSGWCSLKPQIPYEQCVERPLPKESIDLQTIVEGLYHTAACDWIIQGMVESIDSRFSVRFELDDVIRLYDCDATGIASDCLSVLWLLSWWVGVKWPKDGWELWALQFSPATRRRVIDIVQTVFPPIMIVPRADASNVDLGVLWRGAANLRIPISLRVSRRYNHAARIAGASLSRAFKRAFFELQADIMAFAGFAPCPRTKKQPLCK